MVVAKRKPWDIVDDIFTEDEKEIMIDHLLAYQKRGIAWDIYRKKIPSDILRKWKIIMRLCFENGFMAPWADENKRAIYWQRVMDRGDDVETDQCTLCTRTFSSCLGKAFVNEKSEKVFIPCWNE